jgi:hypothetical protein
MIRVAHVYAANAASNSGDYMIGLAFKAYFQEHVLNGAEIEFDDYDCRKQALYHGASALSRLNAYDHILVGGGGLILPDSAPNMVSCWQWVISVEDLSQLTAPIHVLGLGFNVFYGQTMDMPSRSNDARDRRRIPVLTNSLRTLLTKAESFTMRHKWDVEQVRKLVGTPVGDRVSHQECATCWYARKHWLPKMLPARERKYFAIEVKDDRPQRRYHRIGKARFYSELLKVVTELLAKGQQVCYLSHDGSRSFHSYAQTRGMIIPCLLNTSANETAIRANYNKIHTMLCMAGHSQMIGHNCGIRTIGLVTHPKVRNYCDDIDSTDFVMVNNHCKPSELSAAVLAKLPTLSGRMR